MKDGVLEREVCMFNARATVMRVSGANGARNPNNKGENMPRRQNVTSGLINSQDFRTHRPTHLPFVTHLLLLLFFIYNYSSYFALQNSMQILVIKSLDANFDSYMHCEFRPLFVPITSIRAYN